MFNYKVKYGFLTTYDQTMFFKQEQHPKEKDKWVLWHSDVISHSTKSTEVGNNHAKEPRSYHGKVSVRECFLFLGKKIAANDFTAKYPEKPGDWYGHIQDRTTYDPEDYISDGPKPPAGSGGERTGSPLSAAVSQGTSRDRSISRQDATNRPSTRSQAKIEEELVARTRELNISGRSQREPSPQPRIVTVFYDSKQKMWGYKDAKGKMIFVKLQEREGRYFFHVGEILFEAKKDSSGRPRK
ncbi:hypothetical protein B7463_g6962, partial [Scytalidium lignicola]